MTNDVSTDQLRARLSRIEGQIRGISKMLENGRACEDVVTQLMAVRSGVDTVGALMLDVHLCNCINDGDLKEQVEALRSSMRLWWRFAPAAGSAATVDTVSGPEPV